MSLKYAVNHFYFCKNLSPHSNETHSNEQVITCDPILKVLLNILEIEDCVPSPYDNEALAFRKFNPMRAKNLQGMTNQRTWL